MIKKCSSKGKVIKKILSVSFEKIVLSHTAAYYIIHYNIHNILYLKYISFRNHLWIKTTILGFQEEKISLNQNSFIFLENCLLLSNIISAMYEFSDYIVFKVYIPKSELNFLTS